MDGCLYVVFVFTRGGFARISFDLSKIGLASVLNCCIFVEFMYLFCVVFLFIVIKFNLFL